VGWYHGEWKTEMVGGRIEVGKERRSLIDKDGSYYG